MGQTPVDRVKKLLGKLASVEQRQRDIETERREPSSLKPAAEKVVNKFINQVGAVFCSLPRPVDWHSFYNNDLPLLTKLDAKVRDVAIANSLNKSQARSLNVPSPVQPRRIERPR